MVYTLRSVLALAALLALPSTTTALSYYQDVEDGPNVLDECVACPRLYTNFLECQKIVQPGRVGDEVKNCICVPDYHGWFTHLDACRGCTPGTGTDDFWGNMGRMMTALYQTCPGGNITSDGYSLCATNRKYENCMRLQDSSEGETWVSFRGLEDGRYDSNRTQLLNLAAVKANLTTSTTATTEPTGSDTTGLTTTPTTTGTDSEVPDTTDGSENATPTDDTSSAARLGQGFQAGYALGMLVIAGIVGGLA
jgi:hypothetical protein